MARTLQPRIPIHPGEILREETFPALKLNPTQAAEKMRVSRQNLHMICSEKRPITPDMALRLAKLCGGTPDIWLRMQAAYDIATTSRAIAKELREIPTLGKAAG